jgi:hypothetical protein
MVSTIRTLLVVDAEGFSRNRDVELPSLHSEIRRAVECACQRSGLGNAWQDVPLLQSTGDGLFAVLPVDAIVSLIYPFIDRLQDVLAESAAQLRARSLRLRLRAALHTGLVDDEHPVTAGISAATNDVHRLLNCEPLRAALCDSDPDVTFAAVIVSAEVFEMFVRGGHTGLQPSQFTQVRATVKQFDRPAFLYVPVHSQREHPDGFLPDAPGVPASGAAGGMSVNDVSVTGDGVQNIIGNQVGGGIRQERS